MTKRHNVFITYYHDHDQRAKDQFVRMMGDNIVNVSVCQGRGDLVPRGGAKAYHWAVSVQHECHAAVGVSGGS